MKTFNLVVAGYGGQGVLSLAEIIGRAALREGNEVRGVELHGLAQRGGSLLCQVRFGEKVYSPLIRKAGADAIIALDALEGLRSCYYSSRGKTVVVTDSKALAPSPISEKRIDVNNVIGEMRRFAKRVEVVNASEIVEKLTGEIAMSNVFMLGYTIGKGVLPIKRETAWESVTERIRPQFLEMNKKVFDEAFKR
jgi:indolepyruvate ferredoxin oxidoreductase beta subunit